MKLARLVPAALACIAIAVTAACGNSRGATNRADRQLTVFAAASLSSVLPPLDRSSRYRFADSNALELQIKQGAHPDVFVSASPKSLARLQQRGLVLGEPAWFATNALVLIVPRRNPAHIRTVRDLVGKDVRLLLAAPGMPAGDQARKALAAMQLDAALDNIVSGKSDVEAVAAKVARGKADAGFVYASDAKAVATEVLRIPLPRVGREVAVYGAAVLKDASNLQQGRGFVALLRSPVGQTALQQAGFGPPPRVATKTTGPSAGEGSRTG